MRKYNYCELLRTLRPDTLAPEVALVEQLLTMPDASGRCQVFNTS